MTPNEFQQRVVDLARFTSDPTMRAVLGVGSEAGELASILRETLVCGNDPDPTRLMVEFGDVLYYTVLGLKAAGFTLEETMEWTLLKMKRRRTFGKNKEDEAMLLFEYISKIRR